MLLSKGNVLMLILDFSPKPQVIIFKTVGMPIVYTGE